MKRQGNEIEDCFSNLTKDQVDWRCAINITGHISRVSASVNSRMWEILFQIKFLKHAYRIHEQKNFLLN